MNSLNTEKHFKSKRHLFLAWSALLALLLTIGFYLFAILIAIFLLFIPYYMIVYLDFISLYIIIMCFVGFGLILWSIIPRRQKFIIPGLLLNKQDYPHIHEEVENIAKSLNQKNLDEIYIIPEINAWVSSIGGFFGIGSKRILGIGLPLLEILNVSEFRAILAHEFGHYHGGDTKLGPWIYRTRSTIIRTIQKLVDHRSIIQFPFIWYGKLFLRITNSISRNQEYAADKLAVSLTDSESFESGLKKIHGTAPLYDKYFTEDFVPLFSLGYLPQFSEGFKIFIKIKTNAEEIKKIIDTELKEGKIDPYDTHPSLKDRIDSVKDIQSNNKLFDKRPSVVLLGNLRKTEESLFIFINDRDNPNKKLKNINWKDSGQAYIDSWKESHEKNKKIIEGIKTEDIFEINNYINFVKKTNLSFFDEIENELGGKISQQDKMRFLNGEIVRTLTLILIKKGWKLKVSPGEFYLEKGKEKLEIFKLIDEVINAKIKKDKWISLCEKLGISGVDMGKY
jgi:heat shock protein HtpX